MTKVLVTGGNGGLGREIVPRLLRAGYTPRVMSRRPAAEDLESGIEWAQADILDGAGLEEAVNGAEVIIHAASLPFRYKGAVDIQGAERLLELGRNAGVEHFLYISIVGVDRIPFAYYEQKYAAEQVVEKGDLPWSILRATQFHTLLDMWLGGLAKAPVILPVPTAFKFQPIDTREVAARMVEIVGAGPSGRVPDIGGPEVHTFGDIARDWLAARGIGRPIVRLPMPRRVAQSIREGRSTTPANAYGSITWDAWLRETYGGALAAGAMSAKGESA